MYIQGKENTEKARKVLREYRKKQGLSKDWFNNATELEDGDGGWRNLEVDENGKVTCLLEGFYIDEGPNFEEAEIIEEINSNDEDSMTWDDVEFVDIDGVRYVLYEID